MNVPVVADILGTLGAVCWSVQLIPQIIINYRKHDTTGLQPTMMLLWASAGIALGVYNIVQNFNIALKIQPQILTTLSLITWIQCKYYSDHWPWTKSVAILTPIVALMGGLEYGLIFALNRAKGNRTEWPVTFMAILSACLLCAGVLRHYWDIYRQRTVRGISFIFVAIDAGGDLTSLISVLFEPSLDVLGMIIYASELVLWLGVFACGGYFNLRPWLGQKLQGHRNRHVVAQQAEIDAEVAAQDAHNTTSLSRSSTVFRTASQTSQEQRQELQEHELRRRVLPQ